MTRVSVRLLVAGALCAVSAMVFGSLASASGSQIPKTGTGIARTGAFGQGTAGEEFAFDDEDGPDAYNGTISLSSGSGGGPTISGAKKAKSNPSVNTSFEGLNFYQQRYARGGNQFSVEPPDQGLCVGNGFELEVVNDVVNIYNASGQSVLPDNTATNIVGGFPRNVNHAVDLNSFYGYPPAVNRSTGVRGPELTDPSCLYDAATQRWFMVVLTLDRVPGQQPSPGESPRPGRQPDVRPDGKLEHLQDRRDERRHEYGRRQNPGPYLGDYPHIGADANGIYLTTNAYPWCCNGFAGAQIYALSKAQLAAGAANVTMQHIDTSGLVNAPSETGSTQPGFTVWPAQSPGTGSFNTGNGGTEYFLSSNAADEAQKPISGTAGTRTSTQLVVWTHDQHLLAELGVAGGQPVEPDPAGRPVRRPAEAAAARLRHCAGHEHAAGLLPQRHDDGHDRGRRLLAAARRRRSRPTGEVVSRPDSNDTRMQQVTWANGKLWGALDTTVNPDLGPAARRHRVLRRQPERGEDRQPGLPRCGRARLHLPGDRRHGFGPWRDGVHRHG